MKRDLEIIRERWANWIEPGWVRPSLHTTVKDIGWLIAEVYRLREEAGPPVRETEPQKPTNGATFDSGGFIEID